MSYNYKTLIRDNLVDDATIQGLFSAGTTASTHVHMENLFRTGVFPQILIGWNAGETRSNLDADAGQIFLTVECKGSGSLTPYKEVGNFRSAILSAIDDQSLSATSVCYLCRKFSEIEGYSIDRKVHWLRMGFSFEGRQNTSLP